MIRSVVSCVAAGAAILAVMAAPVSAAEMKFKATLTAADEVPPNDSKGTGTADITVDTASRKLSWAVTYSGLTGDPTAAHFHGPAAPGENAPPVVDITANLAKGTADLTEQQAQDLQSGKYYVNIHTAAHPDGEIRGQVEAAQ